MKYINISGFMEPRFEKLIGGGGEKNVYEDPNDPNRVIGVYHEKAPSPRFVEGRQHLTKIMHLLFPKNIPDIYDSSYNPHTIVRQRMQLDEGHTVMQKDYETNFLGKGFDANLREAANVVKRKLEEDPRVRDLSVAMEQLVDRDLNARNYGYDADGNPVFIDTFDPWETYPDGRIATRKFDLVALGEAIEKIEDKSVQKEAKGHLNELWNLLEAERREGSK
ncbi:MAG: hypothetical protein Q7S84_04750 [bacterium]|nr:hypothetical protein [bacterium]